MVMILDVKPGEATEILRVCLDHVKLWWSLSAALFRAMTD